MPQTENQLLYSPQQKVFVAGKTAQIPESLHIPPDALRVVLSSFSGPLDLLLYLIRQKNINILDISIAQITEQYMSYVELIISLNLDLAGDYLLMAAVLGEIKSKMMLPQKPSDEQDEIDPREELIRKLLEYERFKQAAQELDQMPRINRDNFIASAFFERDLTQNQEHINLEQLTAAFAEVQLRARLFNEHNIKTEPLSVKDRMLKILNNLQKQGSCKFSHLFVPAEGVKGVVVTFVAILELIRERLVDVVQGSHFSEIYLEAKDG